MPRTTTRSGQPDIDTADLRQHISHVAAVWERSLAQSGYDAAVVEAGANAMYFLDDQPPPFRPNPHFAHWVPEGDVEHCALVIVPGARPRLMFHQPRDYWHLPPALPDWFSADFDIEVCDAPEAVAEALARALRSLRDANPNVRVAAISPNPQPQNLYADVNPAALLDRLHWHRAYKSPFEVANTRHAMAQAVAGHNAARAAFDDGASEFDIHLAYLTASGQSDADLPYHNIVALNEHAGVLHYQHYDRTPPEHHNSFLIDAGGRQRGYAADVTRTYVNRGGNNAVCDAAAAAQFATLIDAIDARQLALIDAIRPGISYVELHERMHREIAEVLVAAGLVTCSAEAAFDNRVTDRFFPHGLGHLLGLQTHDTGGHLADESGAPAPPPARFPALRFTRTVEAGQIFTIEPGLYFIPMLLDELRAEPAGHDVNWDGVNALLPFGGIRIEDNVLVHENGARNLTREAFAAASG